MSTTIKNAIESLEFMLEYKAEIDKSSKELADYHVCIKALVHAIQERGVDSFISASSLSVIKTGEASLSELVKHYISLVVGDIQVNKDLAMLVKPINLDMESES